MLIRFTVENFLSFNDRIDFNMIASDEDRHHHHVVKGQHENDIDLLRTSVIYGANEAGKSNLIKAMAFAREFIVKGVDKNKGIHVTNFKLDKNCHQKPSRFEFEFRYKRRQFAYGFSVDKSHVLDEWLFEIGHHLEVPIFERDDSGIRFNFEHDLFLGIGEKDKRRMDYEAESTRENLLFLTNCQERNLKWFSQVYEWFDFCLTIIFPNSKVKFLPLLLTNKTDICVFFEQVLKLFGFNIKRMEIKTLDFETLEISATVKKAIKDDFPYGKTGAIGIFSINEEQSYVVIETAGELKALELIIFRNDKAGDEILFELSEESDGTRRIIDLIPMLVSLSKGDSIFVIDEIERSLHVLLIKKLFELILNNKIFENVESQLIASTHEIYLLDIKRLLRKDEIWFISKKKGESHAYSLANADVDNLDLAKGYINGRFGAIPFIQDIRQLRWEK
jgi:AAA15 family ATPase/GTPase